MTDMADVRAQVSALERVLADQQERIGGLEAENAALRARIAELEQRLSKNSRTSSKPPSSDPPWTKPRRRGSPKKRQRGGQPEHPGSNRALLSSDKVDRVEEHRPTCCEKCSALLLGEDSAPRRWQVIETPPVKPVVTEHRVHRLRCLACGHTTQGAVPPEMASAFGTRVHATAAWLTGGLGISKRNVQELLSTLFGLELSLGSISAMERRVADALETPYAEAWATARAAPVLHPDETPWYEDRQLAWLWVMATRQVTVFRIQARRNAEAAKEMLGEDFEGAACTDRHGAYNWIETRGLCWAHLRRNFEAMAETPGGEWYGQRLRAAAGRVITPWYAHARGEIEAEAMFAAISEDRRQIEDVLGWAAAQVPFRRVQRQAQALLDRRDQLWTFLDVSDMPPDNNIAERALRRGVLWRKRSFGTDSSAGSRFAERILTAVETLRAQERDVVDFLTDAYAAHLSQQPSPSLLP